MNEETVAAAEQAALGALMLNTRVVGLFGGLLRPTDFADPWHGQVWTALMERDRAGDPVDVEAMSQAMVDRLGERLGERVRVFDLLHNVPMNCRPLTYCLMVLEASLRREIAGQGVILRAGALQSTLAGSAAPMASASLIVGAALDSVAARWAEARRKEPPAPTTPTPLHPSPTSRELRAGADKFLRDRPARDPQAEQEQAVALIGALLAHPWNIAEVTHWLEPSQVTDPGWRAVLTAAITLTARGEEVDAITVAWASQALAEHGVHVPPVREIREVLDAGWLDHPDRPARLVASQQLSAMAERGAAFLLEAASDPAQPINELLEQCDLMLKDLRRTAAGLETHTGWLTQTTDPPEATRGPVAG